MQELLEHLEAEIEQANYDFDFALAAELQSEWDAVHSRLAA